MKTPRYELELKLSEASGKYVFSSDRGVESPEEILAEEVALLNNIDIEGTDAVLVVDSRIGVEGAVLGDRARNGRVMMTTSKAREALITEINRRKNDSEASCEVMLTSAIDDDCLRKYDKAVYVPRKGDPLHLVKQKILESSRILRDDGSLYISIKSSANSKIKQFMEDCRAFQDLNTVVDGDSTVLKASKSGEDAEDVLKISKLLHSVKGEKILFQSVKGVFDRDEMRKVDMMARELSSVKGSFLDVCFGPGLTGVFGEKLYGVESSFVSDDAYMKKFAGKNAKLNDTDIDAFVDDGVEIFEDSSFNAVALNFREELGLKEFEQVLESCFRVLKPEGKLFIVHSKDFPVEKSVRKFFPGYSVLRREYDFQIVAAEKKVRE